MRAGKQTAAGQFLLDGFEADPRPVAEPSDGKRNLGQFFTTGNPFTAPCFADWWNMVRPDTVLEPFAGANHLPRLLSELGFRAEWACFDLSPPAENTFPSVLVLERDTLRDFPAGFRVVITNPPYLARNSATRRGFAFPPGDRADLSQVALDATLGRCDYAAAILPASFLTQPGQKDRLLAVEDLNRPLFEDTECPVRLALFGPARQADFPVYRNGRRLGMFGELQVWLPSPNEEADWRFNVPDGDLGLNAVDGTKGPSLGFVPGSAIPADAVSEKSRSRTRIAPLRPLTADQLESLIVEANRILTDFRAATCDVPLTPFKGLRADGDYRRRLEYAQAARILDLAAEHLGLPVGDGQLRLW